ncbi:hypothetical protein GCM10009710_14850 [Aeromicrobium alkaliterrae]|uniref:Uncharacterized protein n=1 Tax=Aeromicrobium alkaliterrae TaxID=302168 RepID=A0ABP4VUH5_9ACTN
MQILRCAGAARARTHEGPDSAIAVPGPSGRSDASDQASESLEKLRVRDGSTPMPGPFVVEIVTFLT